MILTRRCPRRCPLTGRPILGIRCMWDLASNIVGCSGVAIDLLRRAGWYLNSSRTITMVSAALFLADLSNLKKAVPPTTQRMIRPYLDSGLDIATTLHPGTPLSDPTLES